MTGDTTVYLSRAYHARTYHRDADCRYLADDYRETTREAVEPVYRCCRRCARRRAGGRG